jgi:FkbM family methyltransferase
MNKHVKIFGRDLEVLVESDADNSVFEEIFLDRDYAMCDEVVKGAGGSGAGGRGGAGEFSGGVILDIGAHKGYFSIYASVLAGVSGNVSGNVSGGRDGVGVGGGVKIFAYEPEEKNFAVLKENLKMNRVKNVFAKNVAVGGKDCVRELFLSKDSHNHSFFGEGAGVVAKKVNCVSLEKIIENHLAKEGCGFVDLVKMDCEGAEFEILEGLDSYIGCAEIFKKIKSFCIEYHEFSEGMRAEKLVKILRGRGYKVEVKKSRYDSRFGMIWARRG